MLADRITISPSTLSTTTLSETILDHSAQDGIDTNTTGSSISSPPAPAVTDTSHSSTLIASPNDQQQQSPLSNNENNSQKNDRIKEDENLNVKDISEDVGESDKEKLTKEHDEKEQLSPPPESLHETTDIHEQTVIDDSDGAESNKGNSTEADNSVDNSMENVPTDGTVTPSDETLTVEIDSPWDNVDSVEGSALREALNLMDNLGSDSDSDSSGGEDIIVCDVVDSEAQKLRGE